VLEELIESRKSALKVEEVAQILNVSQRLIYQLVAVGEIPHFKVGSAVRFEPKALSKWLHEKLEASGKKRAYNNRMMQGRQAPRLCGRLRISGGRLCCRRGRRRAAFNAGVRRLARDYGFR
jgi:excisionase family DNA binding protein